MMSTTNLVIPMILSLLLLLVPFPMATLAWQPIVHRAASSTSTVPRSTLFQQQPQLVLQQQQQQYRESSSLLFSSISKNHRHDVQQQRQGGSNTPFLTLATEWVEYVIMEDETYNKNNNIHHRSSSSSSGSISRRSSNHRMAALTSRLYQRVLVAPTGPLSTVACTLLVALSWIAVRQSMLLLATAVLAWFPASSSSMAALALLS